MKVDTANNNLTVNPKKTIQVHKVATKNTTPT